MSESPSVPICPPAGHPSPAAKERMPVALRVLGARLSGPFGGLSVGARERLAAACVAFASLIETGEDAPDGGVNLRPWSRFLVSALFCLELTRDRLPITSEDEAWLVTEVESDVEGARALLEARAGIAPTEAPTLPPLPLAQLIRS